MPPRLTSHPTAAFGKALAPIALVALALVLAGCGGSGNPKHVPAGDVAVVGKQAIPLASLNELMAQAKASYKERKQAFPKANSTDYTSLRDAAVSYLVDQAEIAQAAKSKLGVEVTDQQVAQRVAQIVKQQFKGKTSLLYAELQKDGTPQDLFRQEVRGTLVSEAVQAKLNASVKVTDADAQSYYKAHRSDYKIPYKYRQVAHILVKTEAEAQKLYRQIEAGGDFTSLAKKYSQDTGSAPNGGILCVSHGGNDTLLGCSQSVPSFDKVAFSLKTGAVSKPVHSQFGWHVIKALGAVTPPSTESFATAKSSIISTLTSKRQQSALSQWVESVTHSYCGGKVLYQVGYQPSTSATGCPVATTTTTG